jgi:hypothetical protein
MKLVLYLDGSELSSKARELLKGEQLVFEEVDAKTPEGASRLLKRTQQRGIPALEIARAHGVGVLTDFDEGYWRNQLRLMLLPR